ncbi:NitT/TauT family transport system ATP-binding protein [Desulfocicer vacuolatum DSM 3385]|uniref:NitT/TauT family transport system ATP-binding protein n=1 Tax=Desulfocicer vacuolatum DSM 3385 TaxID=1121400 RepID=A0A1W2E8F1_9BACT|nr:ABC transporter ATP-binding protein [Desulfocicer vacuolatum]SMD05817.1 NitT/TauT family transport system ATP-binding protein [Desulfocicer vacuolatum DSM 3385]
MLKISGAAKIYGGQTIFSRFDLTVAQGQFNVLVGPSGCGKSTLFDGLTNVISLDKMALSWKGEALPHLGCHAAYMQQKDLLLPWFSLLDNALLPVKIGNQSLAAMTTMAENLFSRMGLKGYESHRPNEVSGGMRQRCALVRTLMFNRDLILLDEPLSALDAITRRRLQSLLLLLQTEFNKTILMITHDIEEALLLADEVYILSPLPMVITDRFVLDQEKPRKFTDPRLLEIKEKVLAQLQEGAHR